MNNEIKEILDFKENADYKKLSCDEIKVLRDYITNLQQENDRLKEALEIKIYCKYANKCNEMYDCSKEEYNDMVESNMELSLRIDKAVEYIKELISATKGTLNDMNYCDKNETITQYVESLEYDINHYEYLLNILKGRSDE